MTSYDNDDTHTSHPEWVVEKRACGFCTVIDCGCEHEPAPLLIPPNILDGMGQE